MVAAVRCGVPYSYMGIIANIGIGIPQTYDNWKEQILLMYEECQHNNAYNESHSIEARHDKKPGNQKQLTTPSSNKNTTEGMSSSPTGKTPGDNKGRDNAGRWMTYSGQRRPMDVDRLERLEHLKKGLCFNCDERGHLSRDCPKPKKVKVRAVEAMPMEPLSQNTKIEEVKE